MEGYFSRKEEQFCSGGEGTRKRKINKEKKTHGQGGGHVWEDEAGWVIAPEIGRRRTLSASTKVP